MHSIASSARLRGALSGLTRAKSSLRVAVGWNCPLALAHLSKNGLISVTRSFTTGRLGSGPISRVSPAVASATCVRQVQRALPFTFIAHEPHMPTRQAARYDKGG